MLVGIAIVSKTQLDAPGSRAESLKLGVPSMDATPYELIGPSKREIPVKYSRYKNKCIAL